jgi:Fe-S-cluster containining protein
MNDGPVRRALKAVARANFFANRLPQRLWLRLRGEAAFTLGGECRRCAACCESPSIRANAAVWYLPTLRRLFLLWQERVNDFALVEARRSDRVFVFRCGHFDAESRLCDSYDSRPGMCRDYPRNLLHQSRPAFLPGCGYRAVAQDARRMLRVLESQPMSEEQRRRLVRDLHLEE